MVPRFGTPKSAKSKFGRERKNAKFLPLWHHSLRRDLIGYGVGLSPFLCCAVVLCFGVFVTKTHCFAEVELVHMEFSVFSKYTSSWRVALSCCITGMSRRCYRRCIITGCLIRVRSVFVSSFVWDSLNCSVSERRLPCKCTQIIFPSSIAILHWLLCKSIHS